MLNSESNIRTNPEALTKIGSYFDAVDNCIQISNINKQSTLNPQTSYSPSLPISAGFYTSIIISPTSQNTVDIYNGFIKAYLEVEFKIKDGIKLNVPKIGSVYPKIWFVFKDARDSIEKYEIEESFITSFCDNETTKRSDIYSTARHIEVSYHDNEGNAITEIKFLKIPLKNDHRRFLLLSNIKCLPAFCGRLELRLFFSCSGIVCCPLLPNQNIMNNYTELSIYEFETITTELVGHLMKM